MDKLSFWVSVLQAIAPILIAIVTIIPTIISNRKKTQDSIAELKAELKSDIKESNDDIEAVKKTLAAHIREDEDSKNRQARIRILRFYDEVCEGKKHSENHFEDIIEDIDDYESYCQGHPDFKNNRGKTACEYIKEIYQKVKAENGFLTHG
jgi:gamma-glutamyl:cysteine ligase YbdK (ATP-grasp superfamily)